ncbi:hypothetical protein LMH87_003102 [Akanthomyces muscarius]|uniref:Transcription regulator Rua1 C-terminal domain-containing protein n=1 Tax=Akanthomyces muscarius TaxID=2231603 RepID=A0A9W8UHP4_AKAMU|nr:hypothetical protein LMH87_003102 [Akanthomyces muscarius]KAJ4148641.1 hypothetical protein LMH87_003102 [Akanthomyces muscarius]
MHHGTYDLGLPLSPTLASHSLLELLQNSAEPLPLNNYYADLPASVDLYLALLEKPAPPPPEDLKPSDPDLIPHKQEPRFEGDMHTPKWVRGHGEKREGWCGLCKPGRWLVLKTSAYWYHKAFTHGISAATGAPFQGPLDKRRIDGKMDVWEGLCGNCNTWIRLFGRKKKGTAWFRHTYKCRSPAKVKDTPKLKRDRAHNVGMPRPHLSPIGLAGMYDQQRVQSTTPTTLSHGLAPAWYAAMADGDGIYPSIPQYMHPLQQHPHHHEPTIGLLKPP